MIQLKYHESTSRGFRKGEENGWMGRLSKGEGGVGISNGEGSEDGGGGGGGYRNESKFRRLLRRAICL
jgi:hypothetical protein